MKRDIGYILFSMLMAAVVLTGCGGSDIIDDDNNVEAPKPLATSNEEIRVNTNVTSMMTRATTIDSNSGLQGYDLKIDAYYNGTDTKFLDGTKLHYNGGDPAWIFWDGSAQLHYYWPIDGSQYGSGSDYTSLDFVGYCPYAKPSYISELTYDYSIGITFTTTMPTTKNEEDEEDEVDYMTSDSQTSFTEFMCAINSNRTAAGGAVPLTFKHPFAYIKFVVGGSDTDITIKGIALSEIKTSGTCVFNGSTSTWSSQSGSATLSITENLQYGSAKTQTNPFLVIPNDYGDKKLTVKVSWTDWGEQIDHYLTTSVDLDWEAGYNYTYTLNVTKTDLIVNTTKFTEQW